MAVIQIRTFRAGEESALRDLFYAAVHQLTVNHYSEDQRRVWAPRDYSSAQWRERLQRNQPFVAEREGALLGFADLQDDGYIDQFFVAPQAAGSGVGGTLMRHLIHTAEQRGISRLWSNVSLNAQPFFQRFGFILEVERDLQIDGVHLRNARMCRRLAPMPDSRPSTEPVCDG